MEKNNEDQRLFLLDAYALIYRAFFAFGRNHRFNSSGLNTSAIYGFITTLVDLIKRESPSHIAVVFDSKEPTFRHKKFPDYKAHREAMPDGIREAIPYIYQVIEAFGIPTIAVPGFEADDIIGTLAKKAAGKGLKVFMMTPDKDYAQLVEKDIYIYKPGRGGSGPEVMGVPEVLAKWEIEKVDQVKDILGLWGDSSDNIPGVPGVGEKTAKKLIAQYGSMEEIFNNTDDLKGALKKKVEENKDQGLLSKWLATIVIDMDVEPDIKAYSLSPPDNDKLKKIFEKLEFRTLAKRIFGTDDTSTEGQLNLFSTANTSSNSKSESPSFQTAYNSYKEGEVDYSLISTKSELDQLGKDLLSKKIVCFDTETTGLDPIEAKLLGISLTWKKGQGVYISVPKEPEAIADFVSGLRNFFSSDRVTKIAQNLKFDLKVLQKYGIEIESPIYDTMIAHYLLHPDSRHNMDHLSRSYLNYDPISISSLIGKRGASQKTMEDVALETVVPYACEDSDITFQLHEKLTQEMSQFNSLEKLLVDVELPLLPVLARMELNGVALDKKGLEEYSIELKSKIEVYKKKIIDTAGVEFNVASPKQLGEVLFDILKLDSKAKRTKTGQYKTDEEVLSRLARKHEIAQTILDYRSLQKLRSTYVEALPALINQKSGLVHTSFHQTVAATGRLSSQNPNLQNIPIRTEEGRQVRRAFIPREKDRLIFSADYSQIELRIMTHFSNEENMLSDFINGLDIHRATASKVFGVSLNEVSGEQRRKAKMVNFGIIYGISAFGLSQRLEISRGDAAELIKNYNISYPGIQEYMTNTIEFARQNGYVETILGRRRYLKDINSPNATVRGFAERNAINAPIQGSAADMIKLAMIKIHNELEKNKLDALMTLQVHDELVFDVHKDAVESLTELVVRNMETAIDLKVPIVVDTGVGADWLEAH